MRLYIDIGFEFVKYVEALPTGKWYIHRDWSGETHLYVQVVYKSCFWYRKIWAHENDCQMAEFIGTYPVNTCKRN